MYINIRNIWISHFITKPGTLHSMVYNVYSVHAINKSAHPFVLMYLYVLFQKENISGMFSSYLNVNNIFRFFLLIIEECNPKFGDFLAPGVKLESYKCVKLVKYEKTHFS